MPTTLLLLGNAVLLSVANEICPLQLNRDTFDGRTVLNVDPCHWMAWLRLLVDESVELLSFTAAFGSRESVMS